MGITNPVFVQLHFLECFSQASARDSVYIVYRVCKCYQLFEKSIKCYKEHLQILASSHIAKDVECQSSSSWTDPTQHSQVWAVHLVPIINNTFLYNQWFSTNACMKYFVGRAILPRGQISFGGGGGQEESDCTTPLRKPGFVLIIYL